MVEPHNHGTLLLVAKTTNSMCSSRSSNGNRCSLYLCCCCCVYRTFYDKQYNYPEKLGLFLIKSFERRNAVVNDQTY